MTGVQTCALPILYMETFQTKRGQICTSDSYRYALYVSDNCQYVISHTSKPQSLTTKLTQVQMTSRASYVQKINVKPCLFFYIPNFLLNLVI